MLYKLSFVMVLLAGAAPLSGETIRIDASRIDPAPTTGYLHMGQQAGPRGRIDINSRYLSLNGHPWFPVMGEFHFSRYPERYWEEELLKMKASGVDTVATYIIWNQQELSPGRLDWHGNRDLRRFVQLCAKHGLHAFIRLGPWVHAETRFGGLPDWVVQAGGLRSDDPTYLRNVERFWSGVADQLHGLLWKDGGPVIGIQIENEYNLSGPGRGAEHIRTLKALAVRLGFDVPLYTVTGWDRAVVPAGEVAPVLGAYTDEPWAVSRDELPPRENFAFRFGSRVAAGLGAQTQADAAGPADADRDRALTPFLGAEYGPGLPEMYRRRTLVAPDDIAATLVTQLGSGLSLLGYYMYHGGANPLVDGRSLEETTASGSYNDVPVIGYDFQAPLGQYGEVNPVQDYLRPFHYFIASYGDRLAGMTPRAPEVVPNGTADLSTPRVAVRGDGHSGFLFMNNHVRHYSMADQHGVRFEVKLADGAVRFPSRPVEVRNGAYFFWPFNMDLGGATLLWASAQPVTRLEGPGGDVHVFMANGNLPAEFAFDATVVDHVSAPTRRDGSRVVVDLRPSHRFVEVRLRDGGTVRLLLLSTADARQLWVGDFLGGRRLLLGPATPFDDNGTLVLRQRGDPGFRFAAWPALDGVTGVQPQGRDGDLLRYGAEARTHPPVEVTARQVRPAGPAPALRLTGPDGTAVQPSPEAYSVSGAWTFTIPPDALAGVSDAWLTIDYRADVGRLFSGERLLDDGFWNGRTWTVGLKRFAELLGHPWMLTLMPLRADAPIYFDRSVRPAFAGAQIAELRRLRITPEYEVRVVPHGASSIGKP